MSGGARVWYFPDGYLPAKTVGEALEAHEYALRIAANRPLVAQFGRLDTTQNNLSYYGSDGFCEAL